MSTFQSVLYGMLCCAVIDIIFDLIVIKCECKKIKYDCDKCSNFKCYFHYCNKKRNEIEDK